MKRYKVGERYVGSRVLRCDTPSGKEEASSRMFWTKEEADQVCTDLRNENPNHRYCVVHYTKEYYVVEEGDVV
jgi:hypothetical protein